MSFTSDTSFSKYSGNGVTVAFPTTFYFLNESDVLVTLTVGGADVVQILNTDYTLTGAGNTGGGTVAFITPPAVGSTVTIERHTPYTQESQFPEGGGFPSKTVERDFDKQTMLAQQNRAAINRSVRVSATSSEGEIPPVSLVPSSLLGFGNDGNPRAMTASQVAVWLNLTQQFFGEGTKTFLNAGDRAAAVPEFLGQVGVQTDNLTIWISYGVTAGDWIAPSINLGDESVTTEMLETAILSADADGLSKIADGFFTADSAGRAKMADGFVTLAKMQSIASGSLIGRASAGTGVPQVITVGDGLTFDGTTLKSAGAVPVGSVIGSAITNITATSTITAAIPYDNTIPQIGEGTEVATVAITPTSTSDKVRIRARFNCQGSANAVFIIALFRNSTANALAAARAYVDGTLIGGVTLEFEDSPASTSEQIYRLRAGTSAGTLYINQTASGQVFNGVANDVTLVAEIIKG